ncbi:hypothetical protein [Halomonas nitroreducens]|uniref:hypothetical protein n=1 Tax=Halomonas nitroreducens TaxID=447425 RepID=UPI0016398AA8
MTDVRHEIGQWRGCYNHVKLQSALGYLPPVAYIQRCAGRSGFSHCGWKITRGKVRSRRALSIKGRS